jgi:hypothetical protein
MIFGLLRVLNGVPKGGIPRSQVKPTPVHSGVAVGILVTSIIVIGVMMVTGLSMGLLTACIVGFSALILGSLFVRGVSEASQKQTRLKNMSPPRPAPPTPMQMRARAAVLERPKTVASQKPCAPASVLSPEPAAHVVKPVVKTYQEILTDRELTARMERIAALLIVTCPDCGAGEAELCSYIQTRRSPCSTASAASSCTTRASGCPSRNTSPRSQTWLRSTTTTFPRAYGGTQYER